VTKLRALAPIAVLLVTVLAAGTAGAKTTRQATTQAPVLQAPVTIDGPSASLDNVSGLSISRDGTGGLVYLETVGGAPHVFVSALAGGQFGAPVEVDASLPGASSQPVIAAGDGGLLIVAFINGGDLVVVSRTSMSQALSGPTDLYNGALNPSIAMSIHSEAYLAFTTPDGNGDDVRDFYYYGGQWQLETGPLNAQAADNAGTGAGAPRAAAAGDGEGLVTWGENGHVYVRRVWYDMTSTALEQADVPSLGGFSEAVADSPTVAVGDDSSFANVAFREVFTNGSQMVSRVFVRRLVGSTLQTVNEADGQPLASGANATAPGLVMMQYGNGFVTSELQGSNQVWATLLGQNGAFNDPARIDGIDGASAPNPVATIAGDYSGLIAWQYDPGGLVSTPDIRARFYAASALGPEEVVSSGDAGPTDAAKGLVAGGDHGGDVAIAYLQGAGSSTVLRVSELVYPPGSFGVASRPRYRTTPEPVLTWAAPRELWGPLTYNVTIDGVASGSTPANSFRPAGPLGQGPHTFQVTAVNQAGLTSSANPGAFFVDSLRPLAQLTLTGRERIGVLLRLRVREGDTPAGVAKADASGIATTSVKWGDGTSQKLRHPTATHRYLRPGRYLLAVTIFDRAGNRTVLARRLRIAR
jgi:hypothetical protein